MHRSRTPSLRAGPSGAFAITLALQFLAVSYTPLARVLGLQPLAAREWVLVLLLAAIPAIVGQLLRSRRRDTATGEPAQERPTGSLQRPPITR